MGGCARRWPLKDEERCGGLGPSRTLGYFILKWQWAADAERARGRRSGCSATLTQP
jgi:hypothetical protein